MGIASFAWDIYFGGESPEARNLRRATPSPWRPVLAVNYRVGPWECSLLRLFDDPPRVAIEVLQGLLRLADRVRVAKKSQRSISVRRNQWERWRSGLMPHFRPTAAELWLATAGEA